MRSNIQIVIVFSVVIFNRNLNLHFLCKKAAVDAGNDESLWILWVSQAVAFVFLFSRRKFVPPQTDANTLHWTSTAFAYVKKYNAISFYIRFSLRQNSLPCEYDVYTLQLYNTRYHRRTRNINFNVNWFVAYYSIDCIGPIIHSYHVPWTNTHIPSVEPTFLPFLFTENDNQNSEKKNGFHFFLSFRSFPFSHLVHFNLL